MAQGGMSIKIVGLKRLFTNLERVLDRVNKQSKILPKAFALDYITLVKDKIKNQNFDKSGWGKIALNDRYAEWKATNYPSAKTWWHLGGDLIKAIAVIQVGENAYAGTIPEAAMDSGSKSYYRNTATSILKYARTLEYGYLPNKIPARPLFGPAAEEYVRNNMFDTHINKALKYIISGWRN